MSEPCNTIKIKATTGSYPYSVINLSDFDPAKHVRYSDTSAVDQAALDAQAALGAAEITGDGSGEPLPPADNELKTAAKRGRK